VIVTCGRKTILDYSNQRRGGRSAKVLGAVGVAYVLMVMPLVVSLFDSGERPEWVVEAACMGAVAFGASLYVVRRRPGDVIGWVGLVGWGLVVVAWVVVPILGRR
jgi:hypothetical protein